MKKIVIIVVPVVVLLLGAVAFMMMKPKAAPPDEKALAKQPGVTYTMADPFIVNLADTGSPHFAKVGIALEVSKLSAGLVPAQEGKDALKVEMDSEIRDIIIAALQERHADELQTVKGREELKEAIVKQVNKKTELKIVEVFFTDFAIQ